MSLLATVQAAGAKPEDAVDYHQSVYTMIKWHFTPIGDMIKGDLPFDAAAVSRSARYVELVSAVALDGFTPGSGPDVVEGTDAKANIWTNWAQFESAMREFQREATQGQRRRCRHHSGAISQDR